MSRLEAFVIPPPAVIIPPAPSPVVVIFVSQMITVVPYNTVDNIEACSGIICTEQGINSLTFTATDEIPNVDVEFIVSWQEVNWI